MKPAILIIDDDADFRTVVAVQLEKAGFEPLQASKKSDVKTMLQGERSVALAIIDGLLPDGNGLDLIADIRAAGFEFPIVFLSAFFRDLKSYQRLTSDFKVALVLHKPISPRELTEHVDSLVFPSTFVYAKPAGSKALDEVASGNRELIRVAKAAAPEANAPETSPQEQPQQPLRPAEPENYVEITDDEDPEIIALRRSYAGKLAERLNEVYALADAAGREPSVDSLNRLHRLAHTLNGTSGSYGFLRVSEVLSDIELAAASGARFEAAEVMKLIAKLREASVELTVSAEIDPAPPEQTDAENWLARIAVISTDEATATDIARLAAESMVRVGTFQTAEGLLANTDDWDAVLIDLPPFHGDFDLSPAYLAAQLLHESKRFLFAPLAFLARENAGLSDRVAAQRLGASLFLTKPLTVGALGEAARILVSLKRAGQPKILIVDDDEDFTRGIASLLVTEGMQVSTLNQPSEILETLDSVRPELLLLDVQMPGVSGFDVCRMLRMHPKWRDLPVIFMTSRLGAAARIVAYEAGGDDYLAKPIVKPELIARIRLRIERGRLLRELLNRDSLTGLLLRRSFLQELRSQLAAAAKYSDPLATAILDVDHFKGINDRYGHGVGDKVLASFGGFLLSRLRAEDLISRWGGEEFAVALYGMSAQQAQSKLMDLLNEFKQIQFSGENGECFWVSFSGGVSDTSNSGLGAEQLLQLADEKLLRAKQEGRSRVIN